MFAKTSQYFHRGPLGVLRLVGGASGPQGSSLAPEALAAQYLSVGQVERAVNLLLSLNWDCQGLQCLTCLHLIANHVLRLPLTPDKEGISIIYVSITYKKSLTTFHILFLVLPQPFEIIFYSEAILLNQNTHYLFNKSTI